MAKIPRTRFLHLLSPLWGEKPQNWPLSKLNTGRFALRAMLPVKNRDTQKKQFSHKVHGVSPETRRVNGGKDL